MNPARPVVRTRQRYQVWLSIAAAALIAGCVGTGAMNPMPSASPGATPIATARVSPVPTPTPGIGVSRAVVMAAVDRELGPHRIVWNAERLSRNGTPLVEGFSTIGSLERLFVVLGGPADNLVSVDAAAGPASSLDEAGLAVAVLRATVPEAEDWFRATFAQPPGFPTETFGSLSVGWARDVGWLHGTRLSAFAVSAFPLPPTPTPMPTRAPTPAPPVTLDPVRLLPATISGVTMQGAHVAVESLADDYPGCVPLCRREVEAFAKQLNVEPSSLYVAIARSADASFPVAVAIIRSPWSPLTSEHDWLESQKTQRPDYVVFAESTEPGVFPSFLVAHHGFPPETGTAPAWYFRGVDDLLIIISDTAAGPGRSPASEAVIDAFRQMP